MQDAGVWSYLSEDSLHSCGFFLPFSLCLCCAVTEFGRELSHKVAKPGFGQEYAPVQAGLEHGSWCFNLLGRVPNTNNVICARMENHRAEEASGLCLCCIFSAASGWRWRLREGAGADTRGCCSRADGHIALLAHQNAPFAISAPGQQGLCCSAPRGSVNLVLEQPEHLEFTCTEVMKVPITFLSPPILLWLF